jgi:regulator of replication initiation timing
MTEPAFPAMFPPKPVEERLTRKEAVALFRKYEERHEKKHCETGITIQVQSSQKLIDALWYALNDEEFFEDPPKRNDEEARAVIQRFALSEDVLYCHAWACAAWPGDTSQDWEVSMFQLQITLTGWSAVSIKDEDCVPIGDRESFLLVRDQRCDAVRNMVQLMIKAMGTMGATYEDIMWDRWEIPLFPTLFEERSWREFVVKALPYRPRPSSPSSDSDDVSDGGEATSTDLWSDDMPLFDVTGGSTGSWRIANSARAKFMMELFDHTHATMKRLYGRVVQLSERIRELNKTQRSMTSEVARLKEENAAHRSRINDLNSRINELETELVDAGSAQKNEGPPKKRKGTNEQDELA